MNESLGFGVLIGIVDDLDDKARLARVRVRFPTLDNVRSNWARLALPGAGAGRGTYFVPEKGDEVLVAFEQGDLRRPFVIGALWSKPDPPPKDDGKPVENNWRQIVSRSGHVIRLDDTKGSEKIELIDMSGDRSVVLDTKGKVIKITARTGTIEIDAQASDVVVRAAKNLTLEAGGSATLKATGTVTIKGSQVLIN